MIAEDVFSNEYFMAEALKLAEQAALCDEVPVGAVIVHENRIIARSYNTRELSQNPIAHAEVLSLQAAASVLNSWRLDQCDLYVTLEPCPMCLGAAINSRIKKIIYGASDPKAGACGSVLNFYAHPGLNHSIEVVGGVMAEECGTILSDFFRAKRKSLKGSP
ncbi:MAG: tRNA adenosine(34) deaminase TadA [Candidatus Margulisiibacteriota bacterium]|nr:MAG: tRNA adenosine(34) deaminase TadA [Candidatus Margulisiibacteriota bacterium]HCY36984.1 tRNA adenosine(34) deaminase TadA [Candidatus Margulisiibacteriota bacterium]